jgi:hypothetical protein
MNTPVYSHTFILPGRPARWSRILQTVVVVAAIILFSFASQGQSTPPPSGSTPPSPIDNQNPTMAANFADGRSIALRSMSGRFPLVAANSGETVSVKLRFASQGRVAVAQCLDGGALSNGAGNIALDANGSGSFQFQLGAKPGLYRVVISSGGARSMLQFWVTDPTSPAANPAALQAQ